MSSSPSSVLLLGMGPQSAGLIITLGFGTAGTSGTDTHDGGDHSRRDREHTEAAARRDEEFRRKRLELRAQLLDAAQRVTGKPPPLDESLRGLASIARRLESFDYPQVLLDIEALERGRIDGDIRDLQQRTQDDDNAMKILLLLAVL